MQILIINGPNLNLLGHREPEIYGTETFEDILSGLRTHFPDITLDYFQSNHEGAIIDRIHTARNESLRGLVINAGAYSHYSYAIHDALLTLKIPKMEVHMSHIHAREAFRRVSVTAPACDATLTGLGKEGYKLAIQFLQDKG